MNNNNEYVVRLFNMGKEVDRLTNIILTLDRQKTLWENNIQSLQLEMANKKMETLLLNKVVDMLNEQKEQASKEIEKLSNELIKTRENMVYLAEHVQQLYKNMDNSIKVLTNKKVNESMSDVYQQINDLIEEKNFLWDIVLQSHSELGGQEKENNYHKAYEILQIIRQKKRLKL